MLLKRLFISFWFICVSGSILCAQASSSPEKLYPIPGKEVVDNRLGNFGGALGIHLLEELLDSKRELKTEREKANHFFRKIDEIADAYGLRVNSDTTGRLQAAIAEKTIFPDKFTCGWWSYHVISGLRALGMKHVLAVNSVGGVGKNGVHQAVMYVDDDDDLIVCDIWQHGVNRSVAIGFSSVRRFPTSADRARAYADWCERQVKAGRPKMTFHRGSDPLRKSAFFNGYVLNMTDRLTEKYQQRDIYLPYLFGTQERYWAEVERLLELMIVKQSTVSFKVMEEAFERSVQKELKRKTKLPQLIGLEIGGAKELLRSADLICNQVTETKIGLDEMDKALKVYRQDPNSSPIYVLRKSPVNLWYYLPPDVSVPDLVGQSPYDANQLIEDAHLKVGDTVALPPDANHPNLRGEVVNQGVPKGILLPAGSKISYIWRRPDASKRWVSIPDVNEQVPHDADRMLRTAGFRVGQPTQAAYNPDKPRLAGKVFWQSATGTAEVGTEIFYAYYGHAGSVTTPVGPNTPPPAPPNHASGLMIKLAGGERRIFVGEKPLFEAWDKSGTNKYPILEIEWVHSDETVLPVGASNGQGKALMAGTVTIMAKHADAWPAYKDVVVWDRVPTLVGKTLGHAEKLMESKSLRLELENPLENRSSDTRISGQSLPANTPVTTDMPVKVTFALTSLVESEDGTEIDQVGGLGLPGQGTNTEGVVGSNGSNSTDPQAQVTVPSVVGVPAARVQTLITNAGLTAAFSGGDPAPDKAREFTVQSQSPVGGTLVSSGSAVTVVVHGAYLVESKSIPNVVGMTAARAKETLASAGFTTSFVGGGPAPKQHLSFTVEKQVPPAGLPESPVSSLTLTLYSEYSDQVPIPSVNGLTREQAEALIHEKGFVPEVTWGDAATRREQIGTVQGQKPVAGETLAQGGTVTVYLYAAVVPSLDGLSIDQARAAITSAWLNPHLIWGDEIHNKNLWETVQSQSPAAGTKVAADTDVRVEIYRDPQEQANPYAVLKGRWRGLYVRGKKRAQLLLTITDVDMKGNFVGQIRWPSYDNGRGATTQVKGQAKGTRVFFQEVKILQGKGVWIGSKGRVQNKYLGTWNASGGTIRGDYHHYWYDEWRDGGDFSLTKQ